MQLCDSVIAKEYSGMSGKGKGLTQVYAQIVGDRVVVKSSDETPAITFDRTPTQVSQLHACASNHLVFIIFLQILKRDIHVPEKRKIAVYQLLDYPPRLAIFAHNVPGQPLPELQVMGLDIEHSFAIASEEF